MKDSGLVVFTKNFGSNFTGATVATYNLVQEFLGEFKEVIVICKNVGNSISDERLKIKVFSTLNEARRHLVKLPPDYVYLSDDHFGYILKMAGREYYHVYHGSWPDAMFLSLRMFVYGLYFLPQYILTLVFAKLIFNVSYYMDKFTRKFNSNTTVIRNGMRHASVSRETEKNLMVKKGKLKIIMVGTIDNLKFRKALELFELFERHELNSICDVHIFGHAKNLKLLEKLGSFNFVHLEGFSANIIYRDFDLYLTTSYFENLSIAVCEALNSEIPVFGFNVGGLNEVVKQYSNGYLAPINKVEYLAKNIKAWYEQSFYLDSSETQLDDFSWEVAAKKYIKNFEIFESLK
ncbi:glycosyltransferase family 4 protein [Fulvivirga sediminis]|uniref:Glycosyltransferase family 4 protein n=1 Tax=Fulvivirga sediminis TaxID=2803949 RepID=A0A937JZ59_9BACT|nr:glycosyltransferase family 4 protein [Fulvivirga sediminis]MBL3654836.1 glycosyltransferase family 4 protein [Fulvivirga sediminis]